MAEGTEEDYLFTGIHNGSIHLDYLPCIYYAMIHNRYAAFNSCDLKNGDETDWHNVRIAVDGMMMKHSEVVMDVVPKGQAVQINQLELEPDVYRLMELTEGVHTTFQLTVLIDGEEAVKKAYPIYLMAYDQWTGSAILPELLASFVTPNAPVLSRVAVNASKFMEQWTESSALDEYQTQDPNRVRQQVAAVYEALRSESLVYAAPPASFEEAGQRIRLVDKVLSEKLGTCIDLTLLYASALESIGIHPLLVLLKGHIFVGARLTTDIYTQTVGDDASYLLKGSADGINDIVLVESTALADSHHIDFETAVVKAQNELKEGDFELFVDVYRCRLNNIRPLPQRINKDGIWMIENDGVEHENATKEVEQLSRYDIKIDESKGKVTKQMLWERKLLDFSLRNNLISIRLGKRTIPFVSFDIDHLEDHLQEGETYQILPSPFKQEVTTDTSGMYDSSKYKQQVEELIVKDLDDKKLHAYMTESELQDRLKFIYRTSRTAMEENGANSLFVVLGVMKWFENPKSIKPRFAPILLLPVDIIRKGGTTGYVIRMRDEDIMLNITLVELLKQQFDLKLSNLDPLLKDDSGLDVKQIFAIVRTCIRNMKGWDVLEESMLGIFSFNKFVMWNDIHSNADKLRENKVISSLMDGRIQWQEDGEEVDARKVDKEMEPANFAIPLDVDSSQMEAIIDSGDGKSFILHGPPGTGKSQTITNMIANALYKGKRVLFVAEKMAALSVVQKRLKKIGLDPFCLEMHSNKATKSHFLEQMNQAIEAVHIKEPEEFAKISKELFERRKELIRYMESLHQSQESGFSLYDCIANYLSVNGEDVQIPPELIDSMTKDKLDKLREELTDLDTVMKVTGHPQEHPLRYLKPRDVTPDSADKIKGLLEEYKKLFIDILQHKQFFADHFSVAVPDTSNGLAWMNRMSDSLVKLPLLNKSILDICANPELLDEWKQVAACGMKKKTIKSSLSKSFASSIFDLDAFALQMEWNAISNKWFLPRFFAKRSFVSRLKAYNPLLNADGVAQLLQQLVDYQRENKVVENHANELTEKFGLLGRRDNEKWEDISKVLEVAPQVYYLLQEYSKNTEIPLVDVLSGFDRQIGTDWNMFKQSYGDTFKRMNDLFARLDAANVNLQVLAEAKFPQEQIHIKIPALIDQWISHLGELKDWYQWCYRERNFVVQKLGTVMDYILDRHKTGKEAADALFKGVSHQMAMKVVNTNKSLQLFNGLLFEGVIDKYRQLTTDFQEVTKKELYYKLASRVPNLLMEAVNSSELGILKRNITNGGRGTTIRRLIDQIPNLLPKLCPCMLMSPISVAQYIDLDRDKFDIVVFDEASQMPTSEAVGAIARGKTLVVVGDPKQMPPTSFFSSTQVEEEEADVDDMESILDDCISLSMPSHYLTWHYRSKHESLIAFSNSQYYDGKLYTFPSVDDRDSKVRLVKVDGIYDKGRTRSNKDEAEAIVKEVLRRLQDAELSKLSIGIVSFSVVQQNLIEDMLTDELAKYPDLETLAYQSEEPVFIKNLENVQGDERDVILFSVGYGQDANGHVSMNFGPLNNEGGERRLNVAVSRARYEMIIFSTLRAEQIDLKRSKAKGVEGLKRFLEFADHGASSISIHQSKSTQQSEMVSVIAKELEAKGYKVDTFVGRSNFKIDLAVLDPKHPDTYLLGILTDGKNYYETKTTRDREICQPNVLRMLKWNIMRIWSVDWLENKEKVLVRVVEKLENLQSPMDNNKAEEAPIYKAKAFNISDEPVVELKNDKEIDYKFAKMPTLKAIGMENLEKNADRMSKYVKDILQVEQPMTMSLIYKRVASIWETKVTAKLKRIVDDRVLSTCIVDPMSPVDNRVIWFDSSVYSHYPYYRINSKRDAGDIPLIEYMNVIQFIIDQQMAIPMDDVKKLTSQLFGFARRTPIADAAVEKAVNALIAKKALMIEGDNVKSGTV